MDLRLEVRPVAESAHAAAGPGSADWLAMLLLVGVVAVSRMPLLGGLAGEPDSALFPIGLWRWVHAGTLATRIYDRQYSPGYYWLAAHLARWSGATFAQYPHLLNWLSFAASLAMAPLAYAVARQVLPVLTAFWATTLWLLAPGVWWLGIEAHPQALGIALVLAALAAHNRAVRGGWAWWSVNLAALIAALQARSDALFLFGAFFVPWCLPVERRPPRRRAVWTAAMLGIAAASFLPLRAWILGGWCAAGEPGTWQRIAGYLGRISPVHQLLPFVTSAGVGTALLALAGWLSLKPRWRWRWAIIVGLWSLPASLFWIAVRGNNVRHVALSLLPLLWAGAAGWSEWSWLRLRRGSDRVALVSAAALLLGLCLPASANVTLFPSGNVPASAHILWQKQAALFALGGRLAAQPRPPCYLGSYTSAYILLGALRSKMPEGETALRLSGELPLTRLWRQDGGPPLVFHDVYSPAEFRAAAASCGRSVSLEYTAAGIPTDPLDPGWFERLHGR